MDKQLIQLIKVVKKTSLNQKHKASTRLLAKEAVKTLMWLAKQPQSIIDEAFERLKL